jgi:transcriptional/translational regulatory protein YebC/TACO1
MYNYAMCAEYSRSWALRRSAKLLQKMLDMFEDNDDVQNVWHNWEDAE